MVTTATLSQRGLPYAAVVSGAATNASLTALHNQGIPYRVEVASGATAASRKALEGRGLAYYVPVGVDATPATKSSLDAQGLAYAVKVDADIPASDRARLDGQGIRYFVEVDSSGNSVPVGGRGQLVNETDGFSVDFTNATDSVRVAVKSGGTVTESSAQTFFGNNTTSPKMIYDSAGTLTWSPHNMFLNSNAPATQSVTTVVGQTYTVTVTGTGTLTGSAGAAGVASAASPLTFTATTTTSTFTLAGSLTTIQMNRGITATQYMATTAAAKYGLALACDPLTRAPLGLYTEQAATNLCLWSNDLSQAAWVKTTATATLTATGPTGATNNASILTATAANATALQAITSASSLRLTSVYLKRRTGTGNIDLTQDNGSTWTTVSVTSAWARYSLPVVTSTNPTIGIRIVTNGDAVDVALAQHETAASQSFASSPIQTFGATATRATDNITVLVSALSTAWNAAGPNSFAFVATELSPAVAAAAYFALHDTTDAERYVFDTGNGARLARMLVVDNNVTTANVFFSGTPSGYVRAAAAAATGDFALAANGSLGAPVLSGTLPTVTTLQVGGNRTTPAVYGYLKSLTILPRRMPNAELQAKAS